MAQDGKQPHLSREPLLMLMDGHAMVHRAWHAIREPLTVQKTGEPVQGVYGFLNSLLWALDELKPTHVAISFDLSGPTFRHQEHSEYKAQRPPTPNDLKAQFPHVRKIVEAFGIPILEHEGFEADDVLGTLCRLADEQGLATVVLTGDSDELQLVSPNVKVLMSFSVQGRTLYDVAKVRDRYDGLGPEAIPDLKALQGDTSDNIPGVPGVGAKTAIRLLKEFGSLEGVFEHVDEVSPDRIRESLKANKDGAFQSKFLATIVREVPVELDLDATRFWEYDRAKIVDLLTDLEFFSIIRRIPDPSGDVATSAQGELMPAEERVQTNVTVVDNGALLAKMVARLESAPLLALDVQTTSASMMAGDLVGLAFSTSAGGAWDVPVGHTSGTQIGRGEVLGAVRPVLEGEGVPKTAHNANYALTVLSRYGIDVKRLSFDPMLAAHLSGRKAVELDQLALEGVREEMTPVSELVGAGRKQVTMAEVAIKDAAAYAASRADVTLRLHDGLLQEVEERGCTRALERIEMPLVPVIVKMQHNGVAVDTDLLERMADELGEKLAVIEATMRETVDGDFNLNSSQQLATVLFDQLGLPRTKKTKTGYSTDASSLEGLKTRLDQGESEGLDDPRAYRVLTGILEYRQLSKIKSTYVDALPLLVNPKTRRIHTSYNQTGSATGRVSSNDPNVQNIPVRTEQGRQVRRAFVAEDSANWTLLAADYSQIELRILAHLSQDPGLLDAFRSGEAIHAATASSVHGIALDEVDPEMRRVAKIMNFGVIYGLSPFGISQQTGLSAEEGKTFIETYFSKYPGIKGYIDSTTAQVKKQGYVETLMGRRRYIPEVHSSNFHVRGAGERMAINMPIQGTAADAIKLAMIAIQSRIEQQMLRTKMILQVHDELIFETPNEELEPIEAAVLELMPGALDLSVPLDVELKTGATGGDME